MKIQELIQYHFGKTRQEVLPGFKQAIREFRTDLVCAAIWETNGNMRLAADLLGVKRTTLIMWFDPCSNGFIDVQRIREVRNETKYDSRQAKDCADACTTSY